MDDHNDATRRAEPVYSHPFDDDKLREECGVYGVFGH